MITYIIGSLAYGQTVETSKISQSQKPRRITMSYGFGVYITQDSDISVADLNREDMGNSFILVNWLGQTLYFNYYANGEPNPHFVVHALPHGTTWHDVHTDMVENPACLFDYLTPGQARIFANAFLRVRAQRNIVRLVNLVRGMLAIAGD